MLLVRRCRDWRSRRWGNHLRNLGQVSDIGHELPDLMVLQIPATDAVADVVEKLTIRRRRDGGRAQRGYAREFIGADRGFPAAVIGVTGFALLPVEFFSCRGVGSVRR